MNKQTKKMIAPIVITMLLTAYFYFYMYAGLALAREWPGILKILLFVVPSSLIVLSTYLLFERIREITEGEEDDLSQY